MNGALAKNERSVRELLRQGVVRLRDANVPSHTLAAELLLLHVTGRDRTSLYTHPDDILPEPTAERFFALVERRIHGEPTQHLTGGQEFWGLDFEVTPDVLIPRPETEHLIEVALDRLTLRQLRAGRSPKFDGDGLTIVDVGTGSGCIAIALAKELPAAKIYATDISHAALEVARRNADRLGFANRLHFLESNLLEAFSPLVHPELDQSATRQSREFSPLATGHSPLLFDLVISNPPYISRREAPGLPVEVREHEPPCALYGGEEGHEFYGPLIVQAHRVLKPAGLLVIELGHDSLPTVRPLLDTPEWANLAVTHDLAGIPRVLSAERC